MIQIQLFIKISIHLFYSLTFAFLVAPLARLGTLTVSFIFIGTMIAIFLLAWIYSVVWRAWCFMLHDLTYNLPFVPLPPPLKCKNRNCGFTVPSVVPPTLFRLRRFHSQSSLNTYTCPVCAHITEYYWTFRLQAHPAVIRYGGRAAPRQESPLRHGSINAQNPSTSGSASTPQFIIIRVCVFKTKSYRVYHTKSLLRHSREGKAKFCRSILLPLM